MQKDRGHTFRDQGPGKEEALKSPLLEAGWEIDALGLSEAEAQTCFPLIPLPSLLPLSCYPRECCLQPGYLWWDRDNHPGQEQARLVSSLACCPEQVLPHAPQYGLKYSLVPHKVLGQGGRAAAGLCVPRDRASLLLGTVGCERPKLPPSPAP